MNQYIVFTVLLLIIDFPVIHKIIEPIYRSIGLMDTFRLKYALVAYLLMGYAWTFIKGDTTKAIKMGMIIYGVYAMTLTAIYKKYSTKYALMEFGWGMMLYYIATSLMNYFYLSS